MTAKTYIYNGQVIKRDEFGKYRTPNMTWGDQPGEFHSFRTLSLAKAFIDSMRSAK